MVLSHIILTALLALGSIAVALPVAPGGATGTTPTPASGAPSQGSLVVGDGVPLENHNKEVALLLGEVMPQGNQASNSVSQTQSSSAAGSSCNVPPLAQSNEVSLFARPSGERKADLLQRMALIKDHTNVHKNYKAQVERLANTFKQKEELDTTADRMNIPATSLEVEGFSRVNYSIILAVKSDPVILF